MLTQQDIKNLIEAMREVFATKEEFTELKSSFNDLQTSMDNITVKFDKFQTEMVVINHRVTKLEKHTGII